eukprot:COSAG06_NODE_1509_length_9241_cov_2.032597_2_plen_290_part_00
MLVPQHFVGPPFPFSSVVFPSLGSGVRTPGPRQLWAQEAARRPAAAAPIAAWRMLVRGLSGRQTQLNVLRPSEKGTINDTRDHPKSSMSQDCPCACEPSHHCGVICMPIMYTRVRRPMALRSRLFSLRLPPLRGMAWLREGKTASAARPIIRSRRRCRCRQRPRRPDSAQRRCTIEQLSVASWNLRLAGRHNITQASRKPPEGAPPTIANWRNTLNHLHMVTTHLRCTQRRSAPAPDAQLNVHKRAPPSHRSRSAGTLGPRCFRWGTSCRRTRCTACPSRSRSARRCGR